MSNHVEVEDKRKPEKRYLVFYVDENTPEGTESYFPVDGANNAFLEKVKLEQKGATKVKVFQEVNLQVKLS